MSLAEQLGNVWRIQDLRRKVLLTLGLLALCRVGVYVPLPGIDVQALDQLLQSMQDAPGGQLLGLVNLFTGGALGRGAIFGLGIMPYISASIIFTLMANVIPSLEQLKKEGAVGQRKLNQYTRVATVFICFFQGAILVRGLVQMVPGIVPVPVQESGARMVVFMLTSGFLMMVGTMFLMWIGEQIDEHGIGNGISLIIMIGILARIPAAITEMAAQIQSAESSQTVILKLLVLFALFVAVIVAIVYITRGERRIPVQQQKHVRGPKVYGGQKHYLPLRVNQAGVMPIIFAQALLTFPVIIAASATNALEGSGSAWYGFFKSIANAVSPGSGLTFSYIVLYGMLIFFFCYFWTAVMFNPKEMSENLQNYGSFIPGIRPGKRTADYLEGIMNRVTLAGSFFLLLIALMPMLVGSFAGGGYSAVAGFYGGTSILIVVGVSLDLWRRINDHLEMRRYSGFAAGSGGRRRSRRR